MAATVQDEAQPRLTARERRELKAAKARDREALTKRWLAEYRRAGAEGRGVGLTLPDDGVLDIGASMIRARIERSAREASPFAERRIEGRLRITAPLIERLVGRSTCGMQEQHLRAAEEIRYVEEAISAIGCVAAQTLACTMSRARGPRENKALGGKAELINDLCYQPWRESILSNPPHLGARGRPVERALQLVLDAVLAGPSLHHLERAYRLKSGSAVEVIRDSLARYTLFADVCD